ncbi:MAG: hypothetical protein GY938_20075, partial [Ketobacter sp.]|nr:hypothetical protein [Ketobacter sp.]
LDLAAGWTLQQRGTVSFQKPTDAYMDVGTSSNAGAVAGKTSRQQVQQQFLTQNPVFMRAAPLWVYRKSIYRDQEV